MVVKDCILSDFFLWLTHWPDPYWYNQGVIKSTTLVRKRTYTHTIRNDDIDLWLFLVKAGGVHPWARFTLRPFSAIFHSMTLTDCTAHTQTFTKEKVSPFAEWLLAEILTVLCLWPQNRHLLELVGPERFCLFSSLGFGSWTTPLLPDVDRELAVFFSYFGFWFLTGFGVDSSYLQTELTDSDIAES